MLVLVLELKADMTNPINPNIILISHAPTDIKRNALMLKSSVLKTFNRIKFANEKRKLNIVIYTTEQESLDEIMDTLLIGLEIKNSIVLSLSSFEIMLDVNMIA